MRRLLDSNIVIYAARPEHGALRQWLSEGACISAVSVIEVLGYPGLTPADIERFERWFTLLETVPISDAVVRRAAELRRMKSTTLGDAIIAATALEIGAELITRNVADFRHVPDLRITNPFDVLPS